MHPIASSVIAICLCAVCLCGVSWAWFTASVSTGATGIQASTYTAEVTVKQGETNVQLSKQNGSFSAKLTGGTYNVTVTTGGTATAGYCRISFAGTEYYTDQLVSGSLSFTVNAGENDTLTITPEWGSCAVQNGNNRLTGGSEIGQKSSGSNNADSVQSASAPADTNPVDTAPVGETAGSANDSAPTDAEDSLQTAE